jgi:hypothetical protein
MPNTLEIYKLQEPDSLATAIANKYVAWDNSRDRWYADARETLENLYATSTHDIFTQYHDWDNSTHIPKMTQIRDMLITYYLDAMFGLPDFVDWDPYDEKGTNFELKNTLKSVMKQMLNDSDFKPTIRQLVEDYVDYGNAFATAVPYRKTLQESVIYEGPKAFRIDPMDIFFDPLASSFEQAPKIIRTTMTLGELMQSAEQFTDDQNLFNKAFKKALKKRHQIYNTIAANNKDAIVDDMCHIAGFDSWSTYYASDVVELLTFYGDLYDCDTGKLHKKTRIVVMDRAYVLLEEPIKDFGFGCNIFKAGWRDRKDNLWSMSPLDNIKGMQYMVDFLENKRADVFNFISNPMVVTQGDAEMPEYLFPGCHIGLDTDATIQFIKPDATALQADLYIDRYLNQMEEMAGMPKEAMGFRTPGEKTAFEISQLNTAASRLFNEKVHKFETEMLEPLLTLMIRLYLSDPDKIVRIKVVDEEGLVSFENVNIEDIKTEGRFVAVGSTTYTEKAQIAQTLMQLSNTALYADPLVSNWIDPKTVAKALIYSTGLDKFNNILDQNARVKSELEMQRAAERANQALDRQRARGIENAQQDAM